MKEVRMTEGYIIVKKLKNGSMKVVASRHFKRDIARDWKRAKANNPDAKMVLLECRRLDSFNVNDKISKKTPKQK